MSKRLPASLLVEIAEQVYKLRQHANSHRDTPAWDRWAEGQHERCVGIESHLRTRNYISPEQAKIIVRGLKQSGFDVPKAISAYAKDGTIKQTQGDMMEAVTMMQSSKQTLDQVMSQYFRLV